MKGKLLFAAGLGVGYVLGTRAGRQRYEQIRSAWLKVWDSPAVQKQVHTVQDYTADRIGDLGTAVTDSIKRAVTKSDGSSSRSKSTGGARSASGSRAAGASTSGSSKSSTAKSSKGSSSGGRDS